MSRPTRHDDTAFPADDVRSDSSPRHGSSTGRLDPHDRRMPVAAAIGPKWGIGLLLLSMTIGIALGLGGGRETDLRHSRPPRSESVAPADDPTVLAANDRPYDRRQSLHTVVYSGYTLGRYLIPGVLFAVVVLLLAARAHRSESRSD